MNSFFDIFNVCCSVQNHIETCKKSRDKKKDEVYLSFEETFSTDNMKNVSSDNSSNPKQFDKDINVLGSPKFNEEIRENNPQKESYSYTRESKKVDNLSQSQKLSEFTFNNKDNSNSNLNTFILDSDNSSRNNINSYPNNIILDHEIKNFKKLYLTDELGDFLFNKSLIINAAGLENGLRNKRDGYTFFGEKSHKGANIINDFIINYKMDEDKDNLFYIVFRRNTQKYYIKNSDEAKNDKSLIYIKNEIEYEIKVKKFFFIGDSLFYVEPIISAEKNSKVNIEFFSKLFQKKFEFSSNDSPITIGRKSCVINLNANIYSKNQCTVYFERNKWFICDGFENKKSTNGTWILIDNKFEINQNTTVKIGANIIRLKLN